MTTPQPLSSLVGQGGLELEVAYCVGGVISPLLCNVALHVLDAEWARTSGSLGVLVRYADDLLVVCRSRVRAEQARRRVAEILAGLGLVLHPDKTRIVCLTRGQQGVASSASSCARWRRGGSGVATTCNDGH